MSQNANNTSPNTDREQASESDTNKFNESLGLVSTILSIVLGIISVTGFFLKNEFSKNLQILSLIALLLATVVFFIFYKKINLSKYTKATIGFIISSIVIISFFSLFYNIRTENNLCNLFDENDKRIKVLFVPFLVADEEDKKIDAIFGPVVNNIREEKLTDYIIVKKCADFKLDARKIDEQDFDKQYFQNILKNANADILVYGRYEPNDKITCCWFSNETVRNELSAIAARNYPGEATYTEDPDSINRVTACPILVASFLSLKFEYLTHQYDLVTHRSNSILNNPNCMDCTISKLTLFMTAASYVAKWEYNNAENVIEIIDSLAKKCLYSNIDIAKKNIIVSELYFGKEQNFLGLSHAREAVSYFNTNAISDTVAYLNAKMLVSQGLSKFSLLTEAIRNSLEIGKLATKYPNVLAANYSGIGSYYSRLYKKGGNYYDSALRYFHLAELHIDQQYPDTIYLNEIYQNIITTYTYKLYVPPKMPYGRKRTSDSLKLVKYVNLQNQLNQTMLAAPKDTSNYTIGMQLRLADIYVTTFAYTENKDTIQYYGDSAKNIYYSIHNKLNLESSTSFNLAYVYGGLSTYYSEINKNEDSSIYYKKKEMEVYKQHPGMDINNAAPSYAILVEHYLKNGDKDSCLKYYNLGISHLDTLKEEATIQNIILPRLQVYFNKIQQL